MAGEENLKLALKHLERALLEKNRAIKDLRVGLDRQRKEIEKENDQIVKDIAKYTALAALNDKSQSQRQSAAATVATLKSEVEENRRRQQEVHDTIKDQIKGLELEIVAITEETNKLKDLR